MCTALTDTSVKTADVVHGLQATEPLQPYPDLHLAKAAEADALAGL